MIDLSMEAFSEEISWDNGQVEELKRGTDEEQWKSALTQVAIIKLQKLRSAEAVQAKSASISGTTDEDQKTNRKRREKHSTVGLERTDSSSDAIVKGVIEDK